MVMETERGFDLAVHIVTMLNQVIYRAMESVTPETVSCELSFFVTRLYHKLIDQPKTVF